VPYLNKLVARSSSGQHCAVQLSLISHSVWCRYTPSRRTRSVCLEHPCITSAQLSVMVVYLPGQEDLAHARDQQHSHAVGDATKISNKTQQWNREDLKQELRH